MTRIPKPFRIEILPLQLLLCLGLPSTALADDKGLIPNSALDNQGMSPTLGGSIQLAPFKYIPPAGFSGKSRQPDPDLPKRSPDQQRLVELNTAGDYQTLGSQGVAMMESDKLDDELKLMIANSLAWTGRLKEAISIYNELSKGKYANDAKVGLANIYRWSGRDDLAAPIYKNVLASDSTNSDAQEGLHLASRELMPRTSLSFGASSDSSEMKRQSGTVNHRWRDPSGAHIYEVETSLVKDALPANQAKQQDASFRYQNLSIALKPSIELSMPTQTNRNLFASMRVNLYDDQIALQAGRVNWGKLATNPNALASGLTALHTGLSAGYNFSFGKLSGRYNFYNVSDGNVVVTSNFNIDSSWRPLGNNLKPFLGVETRYAKFNTPNYWSPATGSGAMYVGLKGEWLATDWSLYAAGQLSVPIWGEAGKGWSFSAGGKRWFSDELAVSMNVWAMANHRDNSSYRAQAASINVEKLWK